MLSTAKTVVMVSEMVGVPVGRGLAPPTDCGRGLAPPTESAVACAYPIALGNERMNIDTNSVRDFFTVTLLSALGAQSRLAQECEDGSADFAYELAEAYAIRNR